MLILKRKKQYINIINKIIMLIIIIFNIIVISYKVEASDSSLGWYISLHKSDPEIKQLIRQKEKQQSEYNVDGKSTGIVDIVIFMGQSNMVGKGDGSSAVDGIDGAGYEMEFNSLGEPYGLRKISEPFGDSTDLDESMISTGSMVTAFMNAYYNNTGVPIVGIPAAISGSSVYTSWQDGQIGLENAKQKYTKTYEWLIQNGFKVRHKYMVWNQGEADKEKVEQYEDALKVTISEMQNIGVEKCFMIRIGGIYVYSDADKEKYEKYTNMINKQTEICEGNNDITLISTCASTLSRCYEMMKDQVHLGQEALDITGSEAGTNMAKYALKYNDYTLSNNQSNALINFANNFSYYGTKTNAILYGTLVKSYSYNLKPVSYADYKDGTRTITYSNNILFWNNLVANTSTKIGSYGANGETTFIQGNYIGLDCSGFISFLYHQVFGIPFDYENSMKYTPWTTAQYIENRKIKNYSGTEEKDTFKTVYQQVFKENTISMSYILNQVDLKVGDLIVGVGMPGDNINHIVIYAGKDENGVNKMIHSTNNPVGYQMKYDDIDKYYYMGESEFLSNHKYRALYVYRLNDGILPDDYVTHEEYKEKSKTSYVDFSKIKDGEKIDNVSPTGNVSFKYDSNKTIVTINVNEDVMQIDDWVLSEDKNVLTKEYVENVNENIALEDLEGNTSILDFNVNIDKEGPQVQYNSNGNIQKSKSHRVMVKVTDELSGVNESSLKYKWTQSNTQEPIDESFTQNFTNEQIITKNTGDGEWYLWILATDRLGNKSKEVTQVFVFDNLGPTTKVEYGITEITNKNITVTITSNEELQEIAGWTLSTDKLKTTKEYSENKQEEIVIKDILGNESKIQILVNNIDKQVPNTQIKYSEIEITKDNVTVTITANEQVEGITGWTLSTDKKILTKEYSKNIQETVVVKDIAGNESKVSIKIQNIIKSANYNIRGDGYITKVQANTTMQEFIKNLGYIINSSYTGIVKTGMAVQINNKTYTIVVAGDITKDGLFDIQDLSNIIAHLSNMENKQLKDEKLIAADINCDNVTDLRDLSKMCLVIANIDTMQLEI